MLKKSLWLAALMGMSLWLAAPAAYANVGECSGGACGTPDTSGGGGCGCGGGSILIANTDFGDTYQYADDFDNDGREDDVDNCPHVSNVDQADSDGDAIGDACDLCKNAADKDQLDTDGDGQGDACDADIDNDGVDNSTDTCPAVSNPQQTDTDKDGKGNACDSDDDGDGTDDLTDTCPLVANAQGADVSAIAGCDEDADADGKLDSKDNCPAMANASQADIDNDKKGDACDDDIDNDGIANAKDNCDSVANLDQVDSDRDGKGDACDERFCYVVDGDDANCLDRETVFQVYSPSVKAQAGEALRLRLFANRSNTAIRYTWTVKDRPNGSTATVKNPRGSVSMSSPYEYFYVKDNVASFQADKPGTYKIQLDGELAFADQVNGQFPRTHSYTMTVTVEGDATGGCSMGGSSAGSMGLGLLLALGALVARRVRR